MSDDTREHTLESVARRQISADDPTLDALTTITIRVENADGWYEVEFTTKLDDLAINAEHYTPAQFLEEQGFNREDYYHPAAMIRAWPAKRVNRISLAAIPVADPMTGVVYVKRTQPPEG